MKEWNFKFLKWKYFFLTILKSKGMISLYTICFEFESVCTGALLFGIVASSSHTRLPLHHRMPVSMSTWVVFNECHMKKRRREKMKISYHSSLSICMYIVYVYIRCQKFKIWEWILMLEALGDGSGKKSLWFFYLSKLPIKQKIWKNLLSLWWFFCLIKYY